MAGLYDIEDPYKKATGGMDRASQTVGRLQASLTTTTTPPGKTAGGAISSGMGGAMAGAMAGAKIAAVGGGWGAAIGAGVGALAYFLS